MAVPPNFTAGQVLTAAQMNAVGMWLIKTQTIGTTVSSVVVANAFSADYENYRIVVSGGVGSAPNDMALVLGASTTGYYSGQGNIAYASDTLGYRRQNNAAAWQVGGVFVGGLNLDVILFSPFATALTGLIVNGLPDYRTTGTGYMGGSGFHNVSASYTDFTISSGATMTGGTIYVYGLRG